MFVLALVSGVAHADPRVTARGRVVDGSGKPIAGATITVEGDPQQATTADDGTFSLDAPAGASLIIDRTGFGTGLATAADQVDDVVLLAAETIEIHGKAPVAAPNDVRLDREKLKRIAGTGNDVVRSLSVMPGVANHPLPLGRGGVVIRGSAPQDSKLLVDGFEVPSIYHDLGFRAVVPMEAIDSLEYIPGGFDVSYGRATSGIASLTTRTGGEHGTEQLEISAGETGALAQGSTEHAKYTFAVRRSMIDLILPYVLPDDLDLSLSTVPRYYDEQVRVDRELSKRWTLRLSSLGSDDVLEVYDSKQLDPDKRLYDRKRFLRMTAAAHYQGGPWSGTLAVSGIDQQYVIERGREQHLAVTAPAVTERAEVIRVAAKAGPLTDLAWKSGGELESTRYTLDVAWPRDPQEGESIDSTTDQMFVGDVTTHDAATWTQLAANVGARVRLTGGVRVDAFARNHDVAVQPRGEVAIRIAPKLITRFAAGAYSRPPEHDGELLEPTLHGERATQLTSGVAYEPIEGLRLTGAVYYTDRRDLIARDPDDAMLTNSGRGTTKGAEILATLDRGRWFGWLGYSYSHSVRVDHPGEPPHLFDFDQPHDVNVAGSCRIGKWVLGSRFRLASGMPQTPVRAALFDSDANTYLPAYGDTNSERAPMHYQVDLRIDKSWRWGPVKMTKFLDIQNLTLNDSAVAYYYNFDYSQRGAFRMLPIIPTAGIRGEY